MKRSSKGFWSSTSSSVSGFWPLKAASRSWTMSPDTAEPRVVYIPQKTRKMPAAARTARRRVVELISLDLDRRHAAHDEVPEGDHHDGDRDDDPAYDVLGHRLEIGRGREVHEDGEDHRKSGDQLAGGASRRRQGGDLALDPDPLADRERDVVQDLRQVAADGPVDGDRRHHQVEVIGLDPLDHVAERLLDRASQVHLADAAGEFL